MINDHDLLVRIDERTRSMSETLMSHISQFGKHVESDQKNFDYVKRWQNWMMGVGSAIVFVTTIALALLTKYVK